MATDPKDMTEADWKKNLTPEQYRVLREKGTEAPGTGDFVDHDADGAYSCAACGQELFTSDTKFESTMPGLVGWPAFAAQAAEGRVELREDISMGMRRTEIVCSRCGSHLGHLFEDDPSSTTGKHYCVNSVSLAFKPKT
jgi:peptide-methionine (R)-S-oxide reductase